MATLKSRGSHEQAFAKIGKALQSFYGYAVTQEMPLEEALTIIRDIEPELRLIVDDCRSRDNDFRWGNETYGYGGDASILGTLHYISDRWNAGFRVTWMMGLLDRYYRRGW